ncbi:hypothetical protein [Hymenobacter defluvii]|uniref:Uncharacterized protein n=1 Tax=Hymenobacter defluvii TaxID=2054411 RepID=A0ABS3TH14_9BACT|nr:hypothetical protein [Hymenobacter defluvii]MBO3272960.1 hypothetical protein [Hymenobacter defluvii]
MKKLITILAPLFCTVAAHAQLAAPWVAFPVDAAITLRVPGKPQPVDITRLEPSLSAKQARGYRYTDAAGTYILMRLEKPMDKFYAKDSDHEFYSQAIDQMMHDAHGTLLDEAILMNGPYQAACAHYTIPGAGPRYMGIALLHHVSYEFQYMPSKPLTKDQDAKLWAQFQQSIVSLK